MCDVYTELEPTTVEMLVRRKHWITWGSSSLLSRQATRLAPRPGHWHPLRLHLHPLQYDLELS